MSLLLVLADESTGGSPTYAQTVLGDSPIAYWRLGEATGSTSAADATGHGHTGTVGAGVTLGVAGAPTAGDGDTAASFDGSSGAAITVAAASGFPTTGPYTIEGWIKPVAGRPLSLLSYGTFGTGNGVNALRTADLSQNNPNTALTNYWWGGNDFSANGTVNLADGGWHHIAATWDGATKRLYVDGQQIGSGAFTGLNAAAANLAIGVGYGNNAQGGIDEVAVYGTALTAAQLAAHYAARNNAAVSAGHLTVSPASLSFAAVAVGASDAAQALTLTNSGGTAITVTAALSGAAAADYTQDAPAGGIALAPNATATLHVGFTAGAAGDRPATLTLTFAGGDNSPVTVALDGTGIAPSGHLVANPTALAFGTAIERTDVYRTLALSNTGTAAAGYSLALSGADAADWSITGTTSGSLSAGADVSIALVFSPTRGGARGATLTITPSDGEAAIVVPLTGASVSSGPTLVVGNVGGSVTPAGQPAFAFVATTGVVDEATTAAIDTEQTTITGDLRQLYSAAAFEGGASDAGFPAGGTITSLALLNGSPAPAGAGWPAWAGQSATRDAYTDGLPVLGISAQQGGGLYYEIGDGMLRPWPNSPALSVSAIAQDETHGTLYIATPRGVFVHTSNLHDLSGWQQVGGLAQTASRLVGAYDASGTFCLYALVKGQAGHPDTLYRTPALAGSVSGAGYDGWTPVLVHQGIIDVTCTDGNTFWVLLSGHESTIYQYVTTNGGGATPIARYDLPAGVQAAGLDRVITAAVPTATPPIPAQDSVWARVAGTAAGDAHAQGAYYLLEGAPGVWGTWQPANPDGTLSGPAGTGLALNKVVGLGLTVNGVYTTAWACTNNGLYVQSSFGGPWQSVCGQDGLTRVELTNVAAGQQQSVAGQGINRVYCVNTTQYFRSNMAAVWWSELTRGKLDLGPWFSALAVSATGDLPSNAVRTIGPMASSPLGLGAATHLQLVESLPDGWYWERHLDGHGDWAYQLVNGAVPIPRLQFAQLSNLQTNEAVPLPQASANLATACVRWLAENSRPQTTVHVAARFATQEAGLRRLRPTMLVTLTLTGEVWQLDSAGRPLQMITVNYQAAPFYVLSRAWRLDAQTGTATVECDLGRSLVGPQPATPDDIAASLYDEIKSIKVFGTRGH